MMVPVEGSEYTVDADLVLIAAGFLGSQDYVTKVIWCRSEMNAQM